MVTDNSIGKVHMAHLGLILTRHFRRDGSSITLTAPTTSQFTFPEDRARSNHSSLRSHIPHLLPTFSPISPAVPPPPSSTMNDSSRPLCPEASAHRSRRNRLPLMPTRHRCRTHPKPALILLLTPTQLAPGNIGNRNKRSDSASTGTTTGPTATGSDTLSNEHVDGFAEPFNLRPCRNNAFADI